MEEYWILRLYRILFIDLRYLFARDANHSAEFECFPRSGFPRS